MKWQQVAHFVANSVWVLTQIEKNKMHMSGDEISKHCTNYTDIEDEQNTFWYIIPMGFEKDCS